METTLKIPPSILKKYEELYDLCENQTQNGLLLPRQVSEFVNKDVAWLLRTTYNGQCPFAFGSDKGVGRGNACFHALPFFSFMTQGMLFRPVADQQFLKDIVRCSA